MIQRRSGQSFCHPLDVVVEHPKPGSRGRSEDFHGKNVHPPRLGPARDERGELECAFRGLHRVVARSRSRRVV